MEGGIPTGLAAREGRGFGITVGSAFVVFGGIALWRDHGFLAQILWGIGGLLLLGALITPIRLKPVERAWMAMALQISKVTTPLVMGIAYFAVLTPIALVMRGIKGNPLNHSAGKLGYWFSRTDSESPKTDMRRQF